MGQAMGEASQPHTRYNHLLGIRGNHCQYFSTLPSLALHTGSTGENDLQTQHRHATNEFKPAKPSFSFPCNLDTNPAKKYRICWKQGQKSASNSLHLDQQPSKRDIPLANTPPFDHPECAPIYKINGHNS